MINLFRKNWPILLVVAVIILLVFLNSKGFLIETKNVFFKISSPFLTFFHSASDKISDFGQSFIKNKSLKRENEELRAKNLEILSGLVKLNEIERENEILKEQFGFSEKQTQIFSRIRGFDERKTSILIDRGENDGMSKNLAVVAMGNVIIGKIIEVYPDFAKVLLINSPKSEVAVMAGENRAKGILRGGMSGDYLNLEMVSKEEEIKIGDKIITSGFDNIFPEGFLIGEIVEVEKNDLGIFQEARVRPYVDFNELEEVFALIEAE